MKKILLTTLVLLCGSISMVGQTTGNIADNYSNQYLVFAGLIDGENEAISTTGYTLRAYIDGELRGEQTMLAQTVSTELTIFYFPIRIGGEAADDGKAITFKLLDERDWEYTLQDASPLNYVNGDATGATPSNLHNFTFIRPESIDFFGEYTLNVGSSVDLDTMYTMVPESANVPEGIAFSLEPSPIGTEYATLTGTILTGTQGGGSVTVDLTCNNFVFSSKIFTIFQPIESLSFTTEYINATATVNINDAAELAEILSGCYETSPLDADEIPVWSSADETIIGKEAVSDSWTPIKVGDCVMRLTAANGASIDLTVTVKQPVTEITTTVTTELELLVGDDLNTYLPYAYTVLPADATDKTVTITSNDVAIVNNSLIAVAEGPCEITITSNDNSAVANTIMVNVSPVYTLSVTNTTLAFQAPTAPETFPVDVTSDIFGNFSFDPTTPAYTITSSNTDVLTVSYGGAVAANDAQILSTGQSVVTVNYDYPHSIVSEGAIVINNVTITESFNVNVAQGLTSFVFTPITTGHTTDTTLTLTPSPAGVVYDASKITIAFATTNMADPEVWYGATATATDATNLTWTISPKSVGSANINVLYDGAIFGTQAININQTVKVDAGWKWISIYGAPVEATSLYGCYGSSLIEIRSQDGLLYNDEVFGYFGDITRLEDHKCYKVKMVADLESYTYDTGNYAYIADEYNMDLQPKWNWIYNPYQYDQPLASAIITGMVEGDRIVSKADGFAEVSDGAWTGSLTTLKNGLGYLYYNAGEAKNITFVAEKTLGAPDPSLNAREINRDKIWLYNDAPYADNMTIVAEINDLEYADNFSIGAFVGDECRGEGVAVDGKFFITVHGNSKEVVSFKLYNSATGEFIDVNTTLNMSKMEGTVKQPVTMNVDWEVTGIKNAQVAVDGTTSIYTIGGRLVKKNATSINDLPAGIYILKTVDANGKTSCKKIIR